MNITAYQLAAKYIGQREVPGRGDNPAILSWLKRLAPWVEHDETANCSAFVSWIAYLLDLPDTKSLTARSWLNVGEPVSPTMWMRGNDIGILWRKSPDSWTGHVGFVDRIESSSIFLLGANQNNAVNVTAYPITRLLGIRRLA